MSELGLRAQTTQKCAETNSESVRIKWHSWYFIITQIKLRVLYYNIQHSSFSTAWERHLTFHIPLKVCLHIFYLCVMSWQWCSWACHRGVHSVLCRLLCGHLRAGHRRPPQWQHHGPQHWTGWTDLHCLPMWQVLYVWYVFTVCLLTFSLFDFCLSSFTLTSVTSWATSSLSLASRGSVYLSYLHTTSFTSFSRARQGTQRSSAGWFNFFFFFFIFSFLRLMKKNHWFTFL